MFSARNIRHGVVAGVIAGIVFTCFLVLSGMLETLGDIIDMPSKMGGLVVHAVMSIGGGIAFAIILGWLIKSWFSAFFFGLLFGLGMWIAGPMTLLPFLSSGVPLFINWSIEGIKQNIPPLIGHLVYGLVLGVVYFAFTRNDP
ncbi:hypothetical protein TUM19329_26500 [Legionella antarctica]|uniref:DUF1440 domain-containing protein n=1 Tax=Legionella antarctica TaxID=2708020 RepID=A0A6F8T753_9GAMM|nr:hypothetical protein [Legionella antarctica]BCA96289.1 hypothetical protein TUM19329_26500 [Legionella antarctica]